jgi:hypothetical protein
MNRTTVLIVVAVNKTAEALLPQIRSLIEAARHQAITAANLSMGYLLDFLGLVGAFYSKLIESEPGR